MKARTLRNIYVIITLIVSIPIIGLLLVLFGIEFKWWIGIISFIFFFIVGRFLYTVFSGINFRGVIFHDELDEEGNTVFNLKSMLGFSPEVLIIGRFKNDLGLTEKDVSQLIYSQLTRHKLKGSEDGGVAIVEFNVNGKKLEIEFQNTGLTLPNLRR